MKIDQSIINAICYPQETSYTDDELRAETRRLTELLYKKFPEDLNFLFEFKFFRDLVRTGVAPFLMKCARNPQILSIAPIFTLTEIKQEQKISLPTKNGVEEFCFSREKPRMRNGEMPAYLQKLKDRLEHRFKEDMEAAKTKPISDALQLGYGPALEILASNELLQAGSIKDLLLALPEKMGTKNGHFYAFWYGLHMLNHGHNLVILEGLADEEAEKVIIEHYEDSEEWLKKAVVSETPEQKTGADITIIHLDNKNNATGGFSVQMKYISREFMPQIKRFAKKALLQVLGRTERPFPLTEPLVYLKTERQLNMGQEISLIEYVRKRLMEEHQNPEFEAPEKILLTIEGPIRTLVHSIYID